MNKTLVTIVSVAALAFLGGCAEKKSCCNPPAPVAKPAPAPVVKAAPAPAPAPVVVEKEVVIEEVEPVVVDEKTRAVQ